MGVVIPMHEPSVIVDRDRNVIVLGDLQVEEETVTRTHVTVGNRQIMLRHDEWRLLAAMLPRPHHLFSTAELCHELELPIGPALLKIASRLRGKLGNDYVHRCHDSWRLLY